MTNSLFTNTITIDAPIDTVQHWLTQPTALPQWNPDVSQVTPLDSQTWDLTRTKTALNQQEQLVLATTPDSVTYTSTGGRLAYQLEFTLSTTSTGTLVHERLTPQSSFPGLTLMAPIAKQAFRHNLQLLQQLCLTAEPKLS